MKKLFGIAALALAIILVALTFSLGVIFGPKQESRADSVRIQKTPLAKVEIIADWSEEKFGYRVVRIAYSDHGIKHQADCFELLTGNGSATSCLPTQ